MYGLHTEKHTLQGKLLSFCLAQDIFHSSPQGKVAVVAHNPVTLLASTRKQWFKLIRHVQRERSSTLNTERIVALSRQLAWMQKLTLTAKSPKDLLEANITFATAEDFVRIPPVCSTVYVTYELEKEKLHMLTSWMPVSGQVVVYE